MRGVTTAEEFLAGYLVRSGMTREQLLERRIVATCSCGDEVCEGWQVISAESEASLLIGRGGLADERLEAAAEAVWNLWGLRDSWDEVEHERAKRMAAEILDAADSVTGAAALKGDDK